MTRGLTSLLVKVIGILSVISPLFVLGNDFRSDTRTQPEITGRQQLEYIFNFEDTSSAGHTDQSQGSIKWSIEELDSPWKQDWSAPEPKSGRKYIRVNRGTPKSFGVAVLSYQDIVLNNVESLNVTFSYWINSKWHNFNNLQFKFYAFCGTNAEDAIAIDDIFVKISSKETTTSLTEIPTESTTEPTTESLTNSTASGSMTTMKFTTESITYSTTPIITMTFTTKSATTESTTKSTTTMAAI